MTFSRAWSDWITALGQAKVEYCRFSLDLARRHGARVFATIVPREAPRAERGDSLGKDYAFLFERFYDFLNGLPGDPMGSLVFDELDRSCRSIRPPLRASANLGEADLSPPFMLPYPDYLVS